MANIAASDWTISLLPTNGTAGVGAHNDQVFIRGRRKISYVRFDLSATQGLAYPSSGGLPVPTWTSTGNTGDTSYGMVRNVNRMKLVEEPANVGVLWNYVASDNAIYGYWSENPTAAGGPSMLKQLPTTANVSELNSAGLSFVFEVEGW